MKNQNEINIIFSFSYESLCSIFICSIFRPSSQAGCSRSASVVIAYLMYKYNLSYQRARDKVKSCRPIIW